MLIAGGALFVTALTLIAALYVSLRTLIAGEAVAGIVIALFALVFV